MTRSDAIAAEIRTQISAKTSDESVAAKEGPQAEQGAARTASGSELPEPVLERNKPEIPAGSEPTSGRPALSSGTNPHSPTVNAVATTVHAPRSSATLNVRWAAAWLVTAAIPALVVWAVMRRPNPPVAAVPSPQSTSVDPRVAAATTEAHPPTPDHRLAAVEKAAVEASAPASSATVEGAPSAVSGNGTVPSAAPEASATPPASTVPTFVATDSADRVAILVTSRPAGARIFRRGKEVGRTPVSIEIGKGEHRIFEVGAPGYATRKLALDGAKSEVEVRLSMAPAPQVVQATPPVVEKERLRDAPPQR